MVRSESFNNWLHRIDEGVRLEDSALNRWLEAIDGSPDSTWKIYVRGLRLYCTRWRVTPQQLFEQRIKEIQPKEAPRDYLVDGQIKSRAKRLMEEMQQEKSDEWPVEFIELLKPGPKSASTCNMVSKALTSFFRVFGEELVLKFNTKDKVNGVSEGSDSITNVQIRRALDFTGDEFPLRNKAITLFLKDSGLRSSDLSLITLQDYRNALKKRKVSKYREPFALFNPITTQKEKIPANIIIGPETIEATNTYLKVERKGENNALFTMRPSKRGDLRIRSEYVAMSPAAISGVIKRMIDRALGAMATTRTTHSLRNFHYNTLQYSGMPVDAIKWLQGKKQNTYHRGYAKVEDTFSIYIEAYDQLRVLSHAPHSDIKINELEKKLKIVKESASEDLKATLRVFNMKVEEQLQNERMTTIRLIESIKDAEELDTSKLMEAYMKSIASVIGDNPRVTVEALNVFSEELRKSKMRTPQASSQEIIENAKKNARVKPKK